VTQKKNKSAKKPASRSKARAAYVDGFVLQVPKKNLAAYKKIASKAGKIWIEHGALSYVESSGDDLKIAGITRTFLKLAKPKPSEVVIFAFITYPSKTVRNRVNRLVMSDPRLEKMMPKPIFDMKKMAYGGFKSLVSL
jgi:uncharacterized protein YbaA (DUF1428 family)